MPGETIIVPFGFAVALPGDFEMQVRSRSGLAAKHGVHVLNGPGTIDADYRGECAAILHNAGKEPFRIDNGMRVAQAVFKRVPLIKLVEVSDLDATERGAGGYGSTGLK